MSKAIILVLKLEHICQIKQFPFGQAGRKLLAKKLIIIYRLILLINWENAVRLMRIIAIQQEIITLILAGMKVEKFLPLICRMNCRIAV